MEAAAPQRDARIMCGKISGWTDGCPAGSVVRSAVWAGPFTTTPPPVCCCGRLAENKSKAREKKTPWPEPAVRQAATLMDAREKGQGGVRVLSSAMMSVQIVISERICDCGGGDTVLLLLARGCSLLLQRL